MALGYGFSLKLAAEARANLVFHFFLPSTIFAFSAGFIGGNMGSRDGVCNDPSLVNSNVS